MVGTKPSSAINYIDEIRSGVALWNEETLLKVYEVGVDPVPSVCEKYKGYVEFTMSAVGTGCSAPFSGGVTGYPINSLERTIYLNCLVADAGQVLPHRSTAGNRGCQQHKRQP